MMKFAFTLLGVVCLLHSVTSQCDLSNKAKDEKDFPNLEAESALSYQMGVEFTVPGAEQSDYYLEYYDILNRKGRVDSHQKGKNLQYIYRTQTWEAWNIENDKCVLINITDTPDFFRDDQTNWIYDPSDFNKRTIGPSAMFKIAYDVWSGGRRRSKMAYMGEFEKLIRGMKAQYWRRCDSTENSFIDYYFTVKEVDNPFNLDILKVMPLRVVFGGTRKDASKELSEQYYDIITFQPLISAGLEPFELPKGMNCRRGLVPDAPQLPNFSGQNLLFNAEVVYRKYKLSKMDEISSYYSTLLFAIDQQTKHLAYRYSPWNTTKPLGSEQKKSLLDAPEYVIYDMKYAFEYKTKFDTGRCEVIRTKSYIPSYTLPENGGSISLTDPYILFPNNELSYLTNSSERGLAVDVFEAEVKNYVLNADTLIPKAIITHSYLKDNEILENTVSIKRAPMQVAIRLFRNKEDIEEVLTFNFFGFTTKLYARRLLFDVSRCFPNDDEYVWLTLGFEADGGDQMDPVTAMRRSWGIRSAMMSYLTTYTDLTPVRVPFILVNPRPSAIYVTILILGRPPLQLEFPDIESDKVIDTTTEMEGLSDFDSCASSCLERRECWGFALCDNVCYYGSKDSQKVVDKKGCNLYRRYSNESSMSSKQVVVENIRMQVEENEVKLRIPMKDNKELVLVATSSFVTDPGEDDSQFRRLGRELNPRMRVLKVGKKLKKGDVVKNMGSLSYEDCQRLCLDFKDCETISFCLKDSVCTITPTHGENIKSEEMEDDNHCNIVTRKYGDHFERTPGITLLETSAADVDAKSVEDCAKACLKETSFKCLSFDHCVGESEKPCRLHTVHYVNPKTKESIKKKSTRCGHYTRKFSIDFKRTNEKRFVGAKMPPINNLTLEECAKSCIEYGEGACYGYDFCQDRRILSTSCTILNEDPSQLQTAYSPVCANFLRSDVEYSPRPYTTGYAAGIGILCFIIGAVVGTAIVFLIAYIRVNRR